MVFMPEYAPFKVLLFLGTIALVGLCAVIALFLWRTGRTAHTRAVVFVSLAALAGYAAFWVGHSLVAPERILAPDEWKYMCEIDCHLAYRVTGVHQSETLGEGDQALKGAGLFWVVSVETRFDENTISSRRPRDLRLYPNPRHIIVADAQGHTYAISGAGMKAIGQPKGEEDPFTRSLLPGESYTVDLVFELPRDVGNPRLLLTSAFWPDVVLIGHEQSPWHKKVWFALE